MALAQKPQRFHPLPVIGYPESYYAKHIKQADDAGDIMAHNAHKVGQYVTLGLDQKRDWEERTKYFKHTLKNHCLAPNDADEQTSAFYQKLQDLVRRYASQEARRMARQENDSYNMRLEMGVPRETLVEEAEVFFPKILGHGGSPEYFTDEVYNEIRTLRDKWV
ncbi:MAG TPA: hypothetical protein VK797_26700 [Tepidisphaeraceae bacterium]|jgi:hypothetical protein|nr:hypothetical protein [Tepidisphaeraceae bacterium]